MRRNLGSLALALPLLMLLGGCGGAGDEKTSSVSTNAGEASAPEKEKGGGESAKLITPDRVVDTQKAVDVVKEELKGGEESLGPSPQDVLSQDPDPRLIKDEPLEISGPPAPGLQSLIAYIPPANPLTRGKFELGKQLYFDPRISLDGTVSCATCHNPEKGWTDRLKTSIGIDGQAGGRNAPTVLNTVYGKSMFWDGRAPSLEGQAQGPPQNPIEMGQQSYKQIIDRLRTISGYREQFQKVFGTDVTLDGIAKAIASFERVAALSGNSKYDKYVAGDLKALNDSEKRGMVLFGIRLDQDDDFKTDVVLQKAKCTLCHAGFNFTDEQFHNLGIGWDEKQSKFADLGRYVIDPIGAKNPADIGAFKTPTVREVVPDRPLHARRQPQDARGRRRALRQGRQRQPLPRQGHEAAEADRPGEGRPGRVHEGSDRRGAQGRPADAARRTRWQEPQPPLGAEDARPQGGLEHLPPVVGPLTDDPFPLFSENRPALYPRSRQGRHAFLIRSQDLGRTAFEASSNLSPDHLADGLGVDGPDDAALGDDARRSGRRGSRRRRGCRRRRPRGRSDGRGRG